MQSFSMFLNPKFAAFALHEMIQIQAMDRARDGALNAHMALLESFNDAITNSWEKATAIIKECEANKPSEF